MHTIVYCQRSWSLHDFAPRPLHDFAPRPFELALLSLPFLLTFPPERMIMKTVQGPSEKLSLSRSIGETDEEEAGVLGAMCCVCSNRRRTCC